jgi:hypothetical protein
VVPRRARVPMCVRCKIKFKNTIKPRPVAGFFVCGMVVRFVYE